MNVRRVMSLVIALGILLTGTSFAEESSCEDNNKIAKQVIRAKDSKDGRRDIKKDSRIDEKNDEVRMQQEYIKGQKRAKETLKYLETVKLVTKGEYSKAHGIAVADKSNRDSVSLGNTGDILVTPPDFKVLKPFGHAAIVAKNRRYTIESYPVIGVSVMKNDWKIRYSSSYAAYPKATNPDISKKAALCAASKEKSNYNYNYNYLDKWRTDKYYCSQLVWRAYYDQGIDLVPQYNYVWPTDLLNKDKVNVFWKKISINQL